MPLQPPGYRAALSAVLAAAAGALLCVFALRYPVDAQGEVYTPETVSADWSMSALRAAIEQPDAEPAALAESIDSWTPDRSKEVVVKALWPFSLAILLPLAGAGIAYQAVRRRSPSKIVSRALYATLFGAVLTQGLLLLFLPAVLSVGVAMFQVRKAEVTAAAAAGGTGGAASAVIDVDAVDEEVDQDDVGEVDDEVADIADEAEQLEVAEPDA
jgi:hypothetical protein